MEGHLYVNFSLFFSPWHLCTAIGKRAHSETSSGASIASSITRLKLFLPCAILKVIHCGVGFGSGDRGPLGTNHLDTFTSAMRSKPVYGIWCSKSA